MRTVFTLLFFCVTCIAVSAKEQSPFYQPKKYFDTTVAQRGFVFRANYNRQDVVNWVEFGFGRMARLQHFDTYGKDVTTASALFTFGADLGYDSSLIVAPKLAVEVAAVALGARVSYGYYMQDGNSSGVISLEGGLNVVSRFFVYAGYNFVKGNSDVPVITEGPKFSAGFTFPLYMRRVQPPKSPTHL